MRKLLNTLYVSSQGSCLRKEGETIVVEREQVKVLQLPVHTIGSVVCFGNVLVSPFLLGFCAENDVSVSFLTEHGRFLRRYAARFRAMCSCADSSIAWPTTKAVRAPLPRTS